jgi:hypothetical protein
VLHHGRGRRVERGAALAAALARAADVGPGWLHARVGSGQGEELGDAQPGGDERGDHGVVAEAGPGAGVGHGEERGCFLFF